MSDNSQSLNVPQSTTTDTSKQSEQLVTDTPVKSPVGQVDNTAKTSANSIPNVSLKKCIICGYESEEKICVKCGMLMEEQCSTCHRTKSDCICNMNKGNNKYE